MIRFKEWCDLVEHAPEKLFTEKDARSYVPIDAKMRMIDVAVKGIDTEKDGKKVYAEPLCIDFDETGYATVNTVNKALYLMQVYLTVYFNVDFDGEDFTAREYDQIVRNGYQARIAKVADKTPVPKTKWLVINQQNDFKTFEKMLNKELSDAVSRYNDPYKRMKPFADDIVDAFLSRIEADLSPEKVQKATEELKQLTAEIEQRQNGLHLVKDDK